MLDTYVQIWPCYEHNSELEVNALSAAFLVMEKLDIKARLVSQVLGVAD